MSRKPIASWLASILGVLMLLGALLLTLSNIRQEQQAGTSAFGALQVLQSVEPTAPPTTLPADPGEPTLQAPDIFIPNYLRDPTIEMPTAEVDGYDYIGILQIPSLELELPIMSDWSYPQLKISPCRYKGSAYQDNMILMAHNYQSHFGRLTELRLEDIVHFTDNEGNRFSYRVVELITLGAYDGQELEAGEWDMTLFTCTLGGRTRVTVRCERWEDTP